MLQVVPQQTYHSKPGSLQLWRVKWVERNASVSRFCFLFAK